MSFTDESTSRSIEPTQERSSFCVKCGNQLPPGHRLCGVCGWLGPGPAGPRQARRRELRRSRHHRMIGGVASGLAAYWGINVTILRSILVALVLLVAVAGVVLLETPLVMVLVAYAVMWLIVPMEDWQDAQ
jgi:phage shock protein C